MEEIQTFDPVKYSEAENDFLLENIGKPVVVAMREVRPPVNPNAVKPIIARIAELEQLKQHEGVNWTGVEAIKASIKAWKRENAKWALDARRNRKAPRWPSRYSFDGKGRPHLGGPGSDSHQIKTYFGPAGERIPFEVDLMPDNVAPWTAPGFTEQFTSGKAGLTEDPDKNRIECFCGHTESYRAESRASHSAARARMSKHLRKADSEKEKHLELYSLEFGE
jgi:hypothetical protein